MSLTNKLILLLKTKSEDDQHDKYETILTENGYKVIKVNTLNFNYKNLNLLRKELLNPKSYAGIILSSPRCVLAIKNTLDVYDMKLSEEWKEKLNYVVGETTHEAAFNLLNLNCLGKETGNADSLSKVLLEADDKNTKVFLYPHGNLKMDILKTAFLDSHIELKEVEVYDTIPNDDIGTEYNVANPSNDIPEYIVFFSPSGVKAFGNIQIPLDDLKLIAIGPTTENAMIKSGLKVFSVAEKPTPECILKLLN